MESLAVRNVIQCRNDAVPGAMFRIWYAGDRMMGNGGDGLRIEGKRGRDRDRNSD